MYYYLICVNKINDKFDDIIFHSVKINLKNIFVVERFLRLNTYKNGGKYPAKNNNKSFLQIPEKRFVTGNILKIRLIILK